MNKQPKLTPEQINDCRSRAHWFLSQGTHSQLTEHFIQQEQFRIEIDRLRERLAASEARVEEEFQKADKLATALVKTEADLGVALAELANCRRLGFPKTRPVDIDE